MKAKTIQRISPTVFVSTEKGFDRYDHYYEPFKQLLQKLIERGEIPRYTGDEIRFDIKDNETVIEVLWKTKEGAEEYATGLRDLDPTGDIVFSIEVVEIPESVVN